MTSDSRCRLVYLSYFKPYLSYSGQIDYKNIDSTNRLLFKKVLFLASPPNHSNLVFCPSSTSLFVRLPPFFPPLHLSLSVDSSAVSTCTSGQRPSRFVSLISYSATECEILHSVHLFHSPPFFPVHILVTTDRSTHLNDACDEWTQEMYGLLLLCPNRGGGRRTSRDPNSKDFATIALASIPGGVHRFYKSYNYFSCDREIKFFPTNIAAFTNYRFMPLHFKKDMVQSKVVTIDQNVEYFYHTPWNNSVSASIL